MNNPAKTKPTNPINYLWEGYYTTWITGVDGGFADTFHAFFLDGGATLFGSSRPQVWREGCELWKADAVGDFEVKGEGEVSGFELTLPHGKHQFRPGASYRFYFPFTEAPDTVAINGEICWRRDSGSENRNLVDFFWRADCESAVVSLIVTRSDRSIRLARPHSAQPGIFEEEGTPSLREAFPELASVPRYEVKPVYRQWLSRNTRLCSWPAPLPVPKWKTDPVGIIIDANGIGEYSFDDQLQNFQHLFRCHRFGAAGIDGMFYWPMGGWPPQYTGFWPHGLIAGDISHKEMDLFMGKNAIRHVILEWCQYGEWVSDRANDWPDPADRYYPRLKYIGAVDQANIILDRYPDVHVYLWAAENRLPGGMHDNRNHIEAPASALPGKLWDQNGDLVTYGLWDKWTKLLKANSEWNKKTLTLFSDPSRVHISCQVSSPFTAVFAPRGGFDIIDTKSLHRQNVQCFVAAGKGVNRTTGLRLQLEIDSYNGNSYNTLGPLEMEQLYRVYYASGADLIYAQADLFGIDDRNRVKPNEVGRGALQAIRWIRQHPRRGRQVIPFSFLQGDAVHICHAPLSLQNRDNQPKNFVRRADELDFAAVTCAVPKMGAWWRCHYEQMFSGAPYGPFEIAPAESALASIPEARVNIMMSWHGMTDQQLANASAAVSRGNVFAAALGHLKQRGEGDWVREGRPFVSGVEQMFGISLVPGAEPALNGADVLVWDLKGAPLVSNHRGAVLVWREWLQLVDADEENRMILAELEKLIASRRSIRFEPDNGYLEASLHERDGLLFLHVFNHARLRQPCGIGKKSPKWKGTVFLDSQLIGDSGAQACRLADDMTLSPSAPVLPREGWIAIEAEVDRHAEWIISLEDSGEVQPRL